MQSKLKKSFAGKYLIKAEPVNMHDLGIFSHVPASANIVSMLTSLIADNFRHLRMCLN